MHSSKFTLLYRIWHWTMALSVIGLLFTVLLRKTFLSYKTNALIIQEQLASINLDISVESAKIVAKAIRAPMWEWHYIFALFLAISILVRIYMLVTKKGIMPLIALIRAPKEEKPKFTVYLFLCAMLMFMTLSGGVLYFHESLGLIKADIAWVKDLHEYMMYAVLTLVILHLGGVFRHEITTKEGIVSKMIHGDS